MSIAEMKQAIHEKVDVLDENQLQQILKLINEPEAETLIDPTKYMDQIFRENDGLLKRLA